MTDKIKIKVKADQSYKKQKFTCECGGTYCYMNKTNHIRTMKHKVFLATNTVKVSTTTGFCKRKQFLDKETLERKRQWYKELKNKKPEIINEPSTDNNVEMLSV